MAVSSFVQSCVTFTYNFLLLSVSFHSTRFFLIIKCRTFILCHLFKINTVYLWSCLVISFDFLKKFDEQAFVKRDVWIKISSRSKYFKIKQFLPYSRRLLDHNLRSLGYKPCLGTFLNSFHSSSQQSKVK